MEFNQEQIDNFVEETGVVKNLRGRPCAMTGINKALIGTKTHMKILENIAREEKLDVFVYYTKAAVEKMVGCTRETVSHWTSVSNNLSGPFLPRILLPPVWIAFNDLVNFFKTRSKMPQSYTLNDLNYLKDINEYLQDPIVMRRLKG